MADVRGLPPHVPALILPRMLTPIDVTSFRRDGYAIARGVFSAAELDRLRPAARRVQAKAKVTLPPGIRFWYGGKEQRALIPDALRGEATWGVNEITRPSLFEADLVDVFAHPGINEAMHRLLGPEPRAWGIKMLWTPRVHPYDLRWHRDFDDRSLYDFVRFKPQAQDHVQFNAALNHDDCFLVVPGSHRRAHTAKEWTAIASRGTAPLPGEVAVVLAPGDVLYMDAHALHRGRSAIAGDRLTLHYSAQAQWVPLKEWDDAEDFAWLMSDAFIGRLAPAARPFYERLRSAVRTDDALGFIRDIALRHGWKPAPQRQGS